MKIGLVGLGSIAKRAYLPILTQRADVEIILCTRNQETIDEIKAKYHLTQSSNTLEELIAHKPDAIFISAATNAHYELARKVLEAKIPLYLDKPISLNMKEIKVLSDYALKHQLIFMTGFNRRYVPVVKQVHDYGIPDLVIYQKNRNLESDIPRRFIVEDFIHVIDTTRYLLQSEITDVLVHSKLEGHLLSHIVVQLKTKDNSAICITNYKNGCTEEIIEVMHPYRKSLIKNLAELEWTENDEKHVVLPQDWQPTLKKRGFEDLIDAFVNSIQSKQQAISIKDAYTTHQICDQIAREIEKKLI